MAENQELAPSETPSGVAQPTEVRIGNLKKSLSQTERSIETALDESKGLVFIAFIGCILIMILAWNVICYFLNEDTKPPCNWTWQFAYHTTIRVTAITAIFGVATFCFKMLRSYLHIYQKTREKLMIVQSMASLVESSSEYMKREVVFDKLLAIITDFGDTGLLDKKSDFTFTNDTIVQLLKTVAKDEK